MVIDSQELLDLIKTKEAIFFDLDGTLIDTEKLYFRFWKEVTRYFGYELKDEEALNMRSLEKQSADEFLIKVSSGLLHYKKCRDKRVELMNEYFSSHDIEIKPGAKEFLNTLRELNKKIYIVTANSLEKANDILMKTGFDKLIDGVISAKETKRGKPFPDPFIYASKVVGLPPKDIIVFEDSPNGLLSSHRAGCFTVMIEDMSKYDESLDYVNAHFSSFLKLL